MSPTATAEEHRGSVVIPRFRPTCQGRTPLKANETRRSTENEVLVDAVSVVLLKACHNSGPGVLSEGHEPRAEEACTSATEG